MKLPTILTSSDDVRHVGMMPFDSVGTITKIEQNGELLVKFAPDAEVELADDDWLFAIVDGRAVPLRIASVKMRGARAAMLRLRHQTTPDDLRILVGCKVFVDADVAPNDEIVEEDYADDDFVGYDVVDVNVGIVGTVTDVDDRVSANPLFVVSSPLGEEILIPIADEFVVDVNDDDKRLVVNLPAGLLSLDEAEEV